MIERIQTDPGDAIPHTIGRRNLRIPLLGSAESFRLQDTTAFFDNFWTLNWYGGVDEHGRAHAELLTAPTFVLLAEKSKPAVVINGLTRITSEAERREQRSLRTRASEPEVYMTSTTSTRVAVANEEVFVPDPFLSVTESEWVEAKPGAADPLPTTRLEVARRGVVLTQGETWGTRGEDPEVIAHHRAAYERAIHTALTEAVALLS